MFYSQSSLMDTEPPFSLHSRDWTGLERMKSASIVSPWTRGELLMNETTSGGTTAGTVKQRTNI